MLRAECDRAMPGSERGRLANGPANPLFILNNTRTHATLSPTPVETLHGGCQATKDAFVGDTRADAKTSLVAVEPSSNPRDAAYCANAHIRLLCGPRYLRAVPLRSQVSTRLDHPPAPAISGFGVSVPEPRARVTPGSIQTAPNDTGRLVDTAPARVRLGTFIPSIPAGDTGERSGIINASHHHRGRRSNHPGISQAKVPQAEGSLESRACSPHRRGKSNALARLTKLSGSNDRGGTL